MNIEETDIAQALAIMMIYNKVHFADSNRKPIGYGHTDMLPISECLKKINYQGYISAEAFAPDH